MTTDNKMAYTTTLNAIRKHSPCTRSWHKLLESLGKTKADGTEVSIKYILDLLGLDDALWALRALPAEHDNAVRLLVCDLIEPSLEYADDQRLAEALQVARAYARGDATADEMAAARAAVWDAARAAARAAVWDAARDAARAAARDAARAAVWDAARDAQTKILQRWLSSAS